MGFKVRWKPVLVWGGVGLGALLLLGFLLPALQPPLVRSQGIQMVTNGVRLNRMMQSTEEPPSFLESFRYPADFPPTTTAAEYLSYLSEKGCFKENDLRLVTGPHHLLARNLHELSNETIAFTIFRFSADDPSETIVLASKPDVFQNHVVVVRKDGSAQIYKLPEGIDEILQHLPAIHPRMVNKLSDGKMLSFMVFPVSHDDPADTVFAVSILKEGAVVIRKGGDAASYKFPEALEAILLHLSPSHPPVFLP